MNHPSWLPPTINLNGNCSEKQKELYSIFVQDFVDPPRPSFRNLPIYYDNRKVDGSSYEEGFWHVVTRTDPSTGERKTIPGEKIRKEAEILKKNDVAITDGVTSPSTRGR